MAGTSAQQSDATGRRARCRKWQLLRVAGKLTSIAYECMAAVKTAVRPAARAPAKGSVATHVSTILPKRLRSTPLRPETANPAKTTAPTLQWVVLTGKPSSVAMTTVMVAASSIAKPIW